MVKFVVPESASEFITTTKSPLPIALMPENVTLEALEPSVTESISVYVGVGIYLIPIRENLLPAAKLVLLARTSMSVTAFVLFQRPLPNEPPRLFPPV